MNESLHALEPRRLMAAYVTDTTWGNGGQLPVIPDGGQPGVYVRDGRIVTTDSIDASDSYEFIYRVARFNADGKADRRFAEYRSSTGYSEQTNNDPRLVGVDAAARPLLSANGVGGVRLIRYKPAGGADKHFNGRLVPPDATGKPVTVTHVEPTPGDDLLAVVVVTGTERKAKDRGVTRYITRLSAVTGNIDTTFGDRGYVLIDQATAAFPGPPIRVTADAAGQVYYSLGENGLYRLRPNGSRDTAAGRRGRIGFPSPAYGFFLDAAGGVLLPAIDHGAYAIFRLGPDGKLDPAFNANSRAFLNETPVGTYAVLPQPDGTVYVQTNDTIRRLTADGTPDRTFDDDGVAGLHRSGGTIGPVVAVLPGGRFLRRGSASEFSAGQYDGLFAVAPVPEISLTANGTVAVYGTGAADSVAVRLEGQTVRVSVNGRVRRFPAAAVRSIYAALDDGDDVFSCSAPIASVVDAGEGDDALIAAYGKNRLFGGDGNDRVTGGQDNDIIYGGNGNDTLYGRAGDDSLFAGLGPYQYAAATRNRLDGGPGQDAGYLEGDDQLISIER